MVDVFGAAGYAGTSNEVTYDGKTKTAFGGEAETAKGTSASLPAETPRERSVS